MPTFASNFMLDGFDFSEEYGEGPLMNRKMPTTSRTTGMAAPPRSENGMAKLPDGIVTNPRAAAVGDDLFLGADGTDVGDLSGMVREASHISDLSWLELAEQDPDRLPKQHNDKVLQGLAESWGVNKRTDGVEIIPNVVVPPPPRSQVALLPGDDTLRQVVASAMRKSAFGVPFQNIVADVASHLGPDALARVATDPRLQRFASAVRSIKDEHGIAGTVYLRDGAFPGLLTGKWDAEIKKRCASAHYWLTRPGSKLAAYDNYLGKRVVTKIPWGEALSHYRPTLEASGKRLASGDPKTVLIAAIRESTSQMRSAAVIARATKFSTYEGQGVGVKAPERRTRNADWAEEETERVIRANEKRAAKSAQDKVASVFRAWVKSGSLTQLQSDQILARASGEDALRLGQHAVNRVRKMEYAGQGWGRSVHTGGPTKKLASANDPKVSQVLRYASAQMNEGAAGNDLDTLLNSRFSQEYLKGAGDQLVQLRRKHEGLAGHVYIAADAYATPAGTTGCDKGALIHRSNQVKAVLQMERCGSCAHNTGGHCQKYNKTLVTAAPVENPEKYQRETIRLANSDDSERTAAMFNSYNPGEFDLQNDSLDTFDYDNLPDNKTLHGVLFEGMILPEE